MTATPLGEVLKKCTNKYDANLLYEENALISKKISVHDNRLSARKISAIFDELPTPLHLKWHKVNRKNYYMSSLNRHQTLISNPGNLGDDLADSLSNGYIEGYVADEEQRPLEFVTLTLVQSNDSSFVMNALSDLNGKYVFSAVNAGNYRIKATSMGFRQAFLPSFTLKAGQKLSLGKTVLLSLTKTLNEVTISATRPLVEKKVDRYIVNVENSTMAFGNSIQLLKSAPFVQVSPSNEISLQGKKTLVLIDDKPFPDVSIKDILLALPAGNILKIELITNPSAKYDAAYGAVINIITKKNQLEGITGNVRINGSLGRYGQYGINSSLTYRKKNLTAYGTIGYERKEVYINSEQHREFSDGNNSSQLVDKTIRRIDDDIYTYQVGADLEIGKGQTIGALINGNVNRWNGNIPSNVSFGEINAPADSVLFTKSTVDFKSETFNFNLNYHLIVDSGKSELVALATFTPYENTLRQSFPSVLVDASGNVIRIPKVFKTTNSPIIKIFITQLDYIHSFEDQLKLEAGIKFQNTNSKSMISYDLQNADQFINIPENSSNNNFSEKIYGIYGTLSKGWSKDKLQLGLRLENTQATTSSILSQHYTQLFPNVLYEHRINDNYNFALSYKRSVSRVPYEELIPYITFIDQYTVYQGNPNLKPKFDNEFVLSVKLKKLNIGATYIDSKGIFTQLPLNRDFNSKVTFFSVQNLNASKDYYVYLYYPFQLFSWWNTENNISPYGHSEANGFVLGRLFKISSNWWNIKSSHFFKFSRNLKMQVDCYYYSPYTGGLTKNGAIGNFDASLLLSILNGKGEIRVGGNDILKRNNNRTYQDFGVYRSSNSLFQDSQRISLGFTYNFGRAKIATPNKDLGNSDAVDRIK
ncbi:outer membrane beta-barrel family protein [Pedobacter psychrotolerans]|nr:outer membrane beta-barrel family protein [Pedobacter psychrotolerans]GGE70537.1 TonB-dependent receptor [Pedobacter psychrotolerans]